MAAEASSSSAASRGRPDSRLWGPTEVPRDMTAACDAGLTSEVPCRGHTDAHGSVPITLTRLTELLLPAPVTGAPAQRSQPRAIPSFVASDGFAFWRTLRILANSVFW